MHMTAYAVLIALVFNWLAPPFQVLPFFVTGEVAIVVLLLAAAVSRRLHDRNLGARWGLAPLPFLIAGLIMFVRLINLAMSGVEADLTVLGPLLVLNNLAYLATLIAGIVVLARKGTRGPHRLGPDPVEDDVAVFD